MKHLVIFHTFSGVMALEKILKKRKMSYETMPAPRHLSTDCGVAILVELKDLNCFLETINLDNIHRIYTMDHGQHDLVFENF